MQPRIKYDKRMLKFAFIALIASVVMILIGVTCAFLEISGTELLMLGCLAFGGGTFLVSVEGLIAISCYLKRLKKYGYEVPEDKRDYNNLQSNLAFTQANVNLNKKHPESFIFFLIYLFTYLCCLAVTIACFIKWSFIPGSATFICVGTGLLDLIWLLFALIFYLQSNQNKYRDDVEYYSKRKPRIQMEFAVGIMLLLLGATCFIKATGNSMLDYSFKSGIMADEDHVVSIKKSFDSAYNDYQDKPEIVQINNMLEGGILISDYDVPPNPFLSDVATSLGIHSFQEVPEWFHVADGPAEIRVQLVNGVIEVTLLNPFDEVGGEISAK